MINPAVLADQNVKLAAEYSQTADRYAVLKQRMAIRWLEIKAEEPKRTAAETDKLWDATPDGQEMLGLHYKLKGLENVIDANKTRIYVANRQANNDY